MYDSGERLCGLAVGGGELAAKRINLPAGGEAKLRRVGRSGAGGGRLAMQKRELLKCSVWWRLGRVAGQPCVPSKM